MWGREAFTGGWGAGRCSRLEGGESCGEKSTSTGGAPRGCTLESEFGVTPNASDQIPRISAGPSKAQWGVPTPRAALFSLRAGFARPGTAALRRGAPTERRPGNRNTVGLHHRDLHFHVESVFHQVRPWEAGHRLRKRQELPVY